MPAKKTKISYSPAATTPSGRQPPRSMVVPMNKPKGTSEMTDWMEEHRAEYDHPLDALHAYQETVCDHTFKEIARGPSGIFSSCTKCRFVKKTK
jgi:hypothetical protein